MNIAASHAPLGYRPVIVGNAVVRMRGDINIREMLWLRDCLQDFRARGHARFVLSMEDMDHVNYLSLGILIEQARIARNMKGDIKLAGMQPHVMKIFMVTGCLAHFEAYRTVEEALRSYDNEWAGVEERQMA